MNTMTVLIEPFFMLPWTKVQVDFLARILSCNHHMYLILLGIQFQTNIYLLLVLTELGGSTAIQYLALTKRL